MTHLLLPARRRALVLLVAVAALMLLGPAASAHVSVSSPDATPGGFGKLVFRVPTESDTLSTVKLLVTLPGSTPFAEVSAKTLPGWVIATTEKPLAKPITSEGFTLTKAVSTVTWTAGKDQGVGPGEFEEFELSVGPFPKGTDPITLPVVQTYSDGSTVTWNQPTPASGSEPEHPVPTLTLAASTPATSSDRTDGLARWLGGAGLVLGAAALTIALVSTRRRAE